MLEIISIAVLMALAYVSAVIRCRKTYEQDAAMLRKFYLKQLHDYIDQDDWTDFDIYRPLRVGFYLVLAEGTQRHESRVHKAIYSDFYKNFINESGVIVPYKVTHFKAIPAKPRHKAGA